MENIRERTKEAPVACKIKDSLKPYSTPTEEETIELCKRAQEGDIDALNECALRNASLVYFYIYNKMSQQRDFFEEDDLFMEGFLALRHAILLFDPSKGIFSSYALLWMRQHMDRYMNSDSAKRLKLQQRDFEKMKKAHAYEQNFFAQNGRKPEVKEIIEHLGCKESEYMRIFFAEDLRRLDEIVKTEGNGTDLFLGDTIPIEERGYRNIEAENFKEVVVDCLKDAFPTEKSREIALKRLGIWDGEPMTSTALAEIYQISSTRVRQIESQAIKALQKPKNKERLKDFFYK